MTPAEQVVCDRVLAWRPLVAAVVPKLDVWLLLGLIAQESQGDPWCWRYEPGFWSIHKRAILAEITQAGHAAWLPHGRLTPEDFDAACDRRAALLAASYGLCQLLLSTALELGAAVTYPVQLCDPTLNLQLGARKLTACFRPIGTDTEPIVAALLRYNGGADATYPTHVLAWRDLLITAGRT